MNLFRTAAAAFALCGVAHASLAQSLWQNYALGMTVAEVQHAAPAAEPVDNPQQSLPDGARTRLSLPAFEIAGRPFRVNFMFTDDKLSHVQLIYRGDDSVDAIRATHTELLTALRAKYGNEVNRAERNVTWVSGKTNVTLTTYLFGRSGMLQVDYSGGVAQAADKL